MPLQNFEAFKLDVNDFCKRLPPKLAVKATKKIAADALTGVVFATPVKTGRARGSWQLDLGQDPEDDPVRLDPTGGVTVASELSKLDGLQPFQSVHIGSNLVYILPLEHGHSEAQAPHGMVAITVARLNAKYAGAKL